jgi:hypothetical protein
MEDVKDGDVFWNKKYNHKVKVHFTLSGSAFYSFTDPQTNEEKICTASTKQAIFEDLETYKNQDLEKDANKMFLECWEKAVNRAGIYRWKNYEQYVSRVTDYFCFEVRQRVKYHIDRHDDGDDFFEENHKD